MRRAGNRKARTKKYDKKITIVTARLFTKKK